MTIPHLMNCSHSGDGWCLDCVAELQSNEDQKCCHCRGSHYKHAVCIRCIHFHVLAMINELEKQIIQPDEEMDGRINRHMIDVWGFRDALNKYFEEEYKK